MNEGRNEETRLERKARKRDKGKWRKDEKGAEIGNREEERFRLQKGNGNGKSRTNGTRGLKREQDDRKASVVPVVP